jgi:hypothetical protein
MPAVRKTLPDWPQENCARERTVAGPFVLAGGLLLRTRQQLDDRIDRVCLREIGSTLESRLDQAADDLCTTDCLAMLQSDVDGKTIEIGDMTVEQHDRNFRPGLGVDNGATAIALSLSHTHSCMGWILTDDDVQFIASAG